MLGFAFAWHYLPQTPLNIFAKIAPIKANAPPTIINGQFGIGQSFARAGVRHGVTGVLQNQIRPGMNPEELEKIRQEIARVASQTMRGV